MIYTLVRTAFTRTQYFCLFMHLHELKEIRNCQMRIDPKKTDAWFFVFAVAIAILFRISSRFLEPNLVVFVRSVCCDCFLIYCFTFN